jgi:hypothetical protein
MLPHSEKFQIIRFAVFALVIGLDRNIFGNFINISLMAPCGLKLKNSRLSASCLREFTEKRLNTSFNRMIFLKNSLSAMV